MAEWTNVVYVNNDLLNKQKGPTDTHSNMDESQKHYAKVKKPGPKQILCDCSISTKYKKGQN